MKVYRLECLEFRLFVETCLNLVTIVVKASLFRLSPMTRRFLSINLQTQTRQVKPTLGSRSTEVQDSLMQNHINLDPSMHYHR